MKIEARITEVSVPTDDKFLCKIAHKVEYRAIDREGKATRWLFHSIHADRDIAEYVKNGVEDNSITPLDALKLFGCLRLGARIADLKERGLNIVTERVVTPNGKRVASYKLVD